LTSPESPPLVPAALALPALADPACRDFLLDLLQQRWQLDAADMAAIDALAQRVRGDDLVICAAVHHGNFPSLEYLAHGLAASGHRTLGVYLLTPPPPATFSDSYGCGGSLGRFAYLMQRLGRGPVYLQAHARWCFLGQLIEAVAPGLTVTQEVYDWMELFVERGHEAPFIAAGWASAPEIALMRNAEAHVRRAPGGFVFKGSRAVLDQAFGPAPGPSLEIAPCPPRAWQQPPLPPPPGPLRLVHAGQLKGAATSRAVFGDLHYLPVIRALTDQGCEVTAYGSAAPDAETFARQWADYRDEAARNPRFVLHPHQPVRTLIQDLPGRFHYGLCAYRFDQDLAVGKRHLDSALASKLFTYLAAGLPVLVSRQLGTMSALVEQHGCGVVLEAGDLERLPARLQGVDHQALREGVVRAQRHFHFERFLPPLIAAVTKRHAPAPVVL
jgi:hypothetical protein